MKIRKLFTRYGRPVSLIDKNGKTIKESKCLIQPLRYKNKMYLEGIPTDIGINETGYYLLLAPPEFGLEQTDSSTYISDGNNNYHIDRSEKIYFKSDVYFIWAIIRLRIPDTYPIYNHFVQE